MEIDRMLLAGAIKSAKAYIKDRPGEDHTALEATIKSTKELLDKHLDDLTDDQFRDLQAEYCISSKLVNYERGPEYGEWLAWSDSFDTVGPVYGSFKDEAIVEMIVAIEGY